MIFAMVAVFLPTRTYAAHSVSVSTSSKYNQEEVKAIVQKTYTYAFNSAEEMFAYEYVLGYLDSASSAGGYYTIYVNRYTGFVYYVNNLTGQILTSNPYNGFSASDETKKELMSQLAISFVETANATQGKNYLSSIWAGEYAQISVSPISQGLRVNYTLGDTSTRFLVPGQITAANYEEYILKPLMKYFEEMLLRYIGDEESGSMFDFFGSESWTEIKDKNPKTYNVYEDGCISQKAIRTYCAVMTKYIDDAYAEDKNNPEKKALNEVKNNIILFDNGFTLYNPTKATEKQLETMNKIAPITADGIAVYAFKHDNVGQKRNFSNMIRTYCPDYTFQLMYEHEAECLYTYEVDQKPVFRCSLEYTFNNDGSLSVRLPANSIAFDETVYTLESITPLQYFGASHLDKEGYVFVPDGSGAVINYEDFYSKTDSNNRLNVTINMGTYGSDYCYSRITGAHREQVTMPVYGVVGQESTSSFDKIYTDADLKTTGFFAILEEGAALANLSVRFGGTQSKFASAFASFTPYPSDTYDLSDTISVGGMSEYTMVSESKYTGSYVTRYVMLEDPALAVAMGRTDFNVASYTGMAT